MNLRRDPKEVAEALLSRSVCSVQVAAILVDKRGIFAWGWNHVGFDGFGCHAEIECLRRANRQRLAQATLYVCARRARNGRTVSARPCTNCQPYLQVVGRVVFRDKDGGWRCL